MMMKHFLLLGLPLLLPLPLVRVFPLVVRGVQIVYDQ
jgi:hypothetical protein